MLTIVALCQFLPGPGSSQFGIAIGRMHGGIAGAFAAWLGFTLPSVLLFIAFAFSYTHLADAASSRLLHSLKLVAAAVVAQAVWSMGRTLCPDRQRASLAVFATALVILPGANYGQIASIVPAAICGAMFLRTSTELPQAPGDMPGTRAEAIARLVIFLLLLLGLPVVSEWYPAYPLQLFSSFYRVGSLVFGGRHVVLPLLQAVVVPPGWVSTNEFLAGYGAAQAIPGPLFAFAAYLSAASKGAQSGPAGAP